MVRYIDSIPCWLRSTTECGAGWQQQMSFGRRAKGLTVVFTTYQSLPVIAEAQQQGVEPFDLIICDEAHRTTGVTLQNTDESNFVRVHDQHYIQGAKRLYMTATPRIFDEKVKDKADEHSAILTSMDDEEVYGPEMHRASFGEAVEHGLLTDYKVLVLTVDQKFIAGPMQQQIVDANHEINLDDAPRLSVAGTVWPSVLVLTSAGRGSRRVRRR